MWNRRDWLVSATAAVGVGSWALRVTGFETPRRKVLFFTKSSGFEHSVVKRSGDELSHAEKILTDIGRENGFDVACTKDGGVFDSDLSGYDAFFFYTTGDLTQAGTDKNPPMSAAGKQRLLDAVKSGKGFLASHCGSDTFHSVGPRFEEQTELDPYIAMLGGEFIRHGKQQEARMKVIDAKFPGLKAAGAGFSCAEEWYSLKNFAPDLHVILVQDTQGMEGSDYERPPYPATWARMHGQGRVFYTSMGHREDVWTNPTFQQVVLGGLAWACRNVEAGIPANVDEATPGAHVMPPEPPPVPKKELPKPKKNSPKPAATN